MVTRVKVSKSEEIIDMLSRSETFKKFADKLPSNFSTKDVNVKISYVPPPQKETWTKMPTGETTREFSGNIKQRKTPQEKKKVGRLITKTEFYEDGTSSRVRYWSED